LTKKRVDRRLMAILAADVAGYSRLMGADEEGTLAQLKTHRRDLTDRSIKKHRGVIIKTTGDGMLVEFASAVEAVRCAAEIQHGMIDRNADVPTEKRIEFRIGIHVGDIIEDDGDIFGDGVNVAARLEALAEANAEVLALTSSSYRQSFCFLVRKEELAAAMKSLEDVGEFRGWNARSGIHHGYLHHRATVAPHAQGHR